MTQNNIKNDKSMKKKEMDIYEKITKKYLMNIGYKESDIDYEPRGTSSAPDFFLSKENIAIEVVSLHQNYFDRGSVKSLGHE